MRSHALLAALLTLALGCTREPARSRPPRRPAAPTSAAPTAATPSVPDREPPPAAVVQRWTGEGESLAASAGQAATIVVAQLGALGMPTAGSPEVTTFPASRWTVIRSLKGSLQGEVTLRLSVQTLPVDRVEQVPRPNERYVLFMGEGAEGATQIRKVLPATPANLTQLDALAGR